MYLNSLFCISLSIILFCRLCLSWPFPFFLLSAFLSSGRKRCLQIQPHFGVTPYSHSVQKTCALLLGVKWVKGQSPVIKSDLLGPTKELRVLHLARLSKSRRELLNRGGSLSALCSFVEFTNIYWPSATVWPHTQHYNLGHVSSDAYGRLAICHTHKVLYIYSFIFL